ncbi:MAG: P44/Msp2 family outer membrane protein [Rhizomicrobium sp.]
MGPFAPARRPADPYSSPYDGAFNSACLGLRGSIIDGSDTHTRSGGTDLRAHYYSTGYGGSAYVGTQLGYGFRVEAELLYHHVTLDRPDVAGAPQAGRDGYLQTVAPMANLYWDLPVPEFIVRPFIAAGVGGAYTDAHDRVGPAQVIGGDKWRFAYQLMAGVALPLSQTARLTGLYRYFRVQDARYRCAPPALPTTSCGANTADQSVDLGLEFDI